VHRQYRQEKRSRGDYTRQIEALNKSICNGSDRSTGNLPDFVPSYINDLISEYYHGRLHSHQATDWRTEKQPVSCIYFDPISKEECSQLADEARKPDLCP
jgi:hypothetical protein